MARTKAKTKTVHIEEPDVEVIEYNADILRDQIVEKYGTVERYTNISLQRKNAKGEWENVSKFDDLPDWFDIKRDHGGGSFKLWIQWYDQDGGRHVDTRFFQIEGTPIYSNPTIPAPSAAVNTSNNFLIDTIRTLKDLGLLGQQKSNDIQLVVQSMKDNTALMVKMFENLNKKEPEEYVKQILELSLNKAFDKTDQGEIEKFIKVYTMINKLAPKVAGGGSETDLIGLITGIMSKVPALGGGTATAPGADPNSVAAASGGENPVTMLLTTLQNINTNITLISDRMSRLEHDYYDITEEPEQPIISNNGNSNNMNKEDQESTWKKLAAEFINLPENKKVETLKVYLLLYPQKDVYDIFINYGFGKTMEEFNGYCVKAGFPELKPEQQIK